MGHLLREIEGSLLNLLAPAELLGRSSEPGAHKKKVIAALEFLGIEQTDPIGYAWIGRLDGKGAFHTRAHRRALERPRPVDAEFRDLWNIDLWLLDEILRRLEVKYLDLHKRIDEIVSTIGVPGRDIRKRLKEHVPQNGVSHEYFFQKLTDGRRSDWIRPLLDAGWFSDPPPAVLNEEKSGITYPSWPASKFLAAVAPIPAAQSDVIDVIRAVPDVDNVFVCRDLVIALAALPVALSRHQVDRVLAWLTLDNADFLAEEIAAFACRLGREGLIGDALGVARALLCVTSDPAWSTPEEGDGYRRLPEARARVSQWHYERLLKKHLRPLAELDAQKFLDLLVDLLSEALRLSVREPDKPQKGDLSYIWRSAIEDHGQNVNDTVADHLISSVRDLCVDICVSNPGAVRKLVDDLEARQWPVFRRLALHLLTEAGASALDLIAQRCVDRSLIDDVDVHHERVKLLQRHFTRLDVADRERFLACIEEGPDVASYSEWILGAEDREPTAHEAEEYKTRWQLRELSPIKEALPQMWRERYEAWVRAFGEPQHPEFLSYRTVGFGPTSPAEAAGLMQRPIDEIVSFLQHWMPPSGFMAPTRDGLGRELTAAATRSPDVFSSAASKFKGLDPTYVNALFQGFRAGVQGYQQFDWQAVLTLAEWVIEQPRDIPGRTSIRFDQDPHWGWTRAAIARLLEYGFFDQRCPIPLELQDRVWKVLEPIASDADPSVEDDEKYGRDPVRQALNCTRGTATLCLFAYARWLRMGMENSADASRPAASELDAMARVKQLLEQKLDPAVEPSPAVRSVYGQQFPFLVLLDPKWAESNVRKIFQSIGSNRLGESAWKSFLVSRGPSEDTFKLLEPVYRAACERLQDASRQPDDDDEQWFKNPREGLAEHMIHLCLLGLSEIDDPGGVLSLFFTNAPEDLRAHAIGYMGRSLYSMEEEHIDEPFASRAVALWEARIAAAERDPEHHAAEVAEFGWWFASGKLEEAWSMQQLLRVIACANRICDDLFVVERLAKIAESNTLEAVKCFEAIAAGHLGQWTVSMWREPGRRLLGCALSSGTDAAVKAREIINRLGARGHVEFADLLDSASA